jgi:hypothetical protein
MGHSSVSFHFRATDETALNTHLVDRGISHFLIAPAKNGWVSLYEERASRQDEGLICDLAAGISEDLKTAAIAFSVHDSDIACYWLYENGKLLDKFNSSPDYFGADGPVPATARGGEPGILSRFCQAGVSEDDLSQILGAGMVFTEEMLDQLCNEETSAAATEALASDYVPAEDLIAQLAEKMGISPARALADYRGGIPEGD